MQRVNPFVERKFISTIPIRYSMHTVWNTKHIFVKPLVVFPFCLQRILSNWTTLTTHLRHERRFKSRQLPYYRDLKRMRL